MEIIKNTILIKYPMIFSKKMKDTISYFEWNILSELVVQANYIVDTFNMWSAEFINVQKHMNDLNNPHGVTAEQVDTYTKVVIDNKDSSTLQQAKDYTYSQVEIDNKDTTIMNKVNSLENGTTIVKKAEQDASGNVITSTYETKIDATNKLAAKVDKTTKIIGIDLQDDILLTEFKTALGNATQSVAGLLSAEDKTHLDGLVALLESSDGNNVVDTIGEILAIFQNYPEGADLVTVLNGKVDKVAGKALSQNDFTDALKNKLEGLLNGSQYYDKTYIDALKDKNGWESELLGTLSNNGTIVLSVINQYDEIQMYAKDTLGVIDNENIRPSLIQSGDSVYFFDDTQAFIMVDTVFGFYAPVGYTLQVVGIKYTELVADDVRFNGSGTNYLTDKTEVESAVKELDTRVKTNTDRIDGLKIDFNSFKQEVEELHTTDSTDTVSGVNNIQLPSNVAKAPIRVGFGYEKEENKNLMRPNLIGSDNLGDGWYRIIENGWGSVNVDYNVYFGYIRLNGLASKTGWGLPFFDTSNIELGKTHTFSIWRVSGDSVGGSGNNDFGIAVSGSSVLHIPKNSSFATRNRIVEALPKTINLGDLGSSSEHVGIEYNNLIFKVQIEEGTQSTAYQIPYIDGYSNAPQTNLRFTIDNTSMYIRGDRELLDGEEVIYSDGKYFIKSNSDYLPMESSGMAISKPNERVLVENAMQEVMLYDNGLEVSEDYKIDELEVLTVINQDGTETNLNLNNATITDTKITHPDISNGDLVYFTYKYQGNFPEVEYEILYYTDVLKTKLDMVLEYIKDTRFDNYEDFEKYWESQFDFLVDGQGIIRAYNGSSEYIKFPDYAKGIEGDRLFNSLHNVKLIEVNEGLLSIGNNVFKEFPFQIEFIMPKTVKEVGMSSFWYSKFSKIELGLGLETIRYTAFMGINWVEFPIVFQENIELIEDMACRGAGEIPYFVFLGATPPTLIGTPITTSLENTIYVKDEYLETYEQHPDFQQYLATLKPLSELEDTNQDNILGLFGETIPHKFEIIFETPDDVKAHQGVTKTDTHFFTSAGDGGVAGGHQYEIYKWDLDWNLIETVDCRNDAPEYIGQINGLYYDKDDNLLYVSSGNHDLSPHKGWVLVYNPDDMSFIKSHFVGLQRSEALVKWNGYWWTVGGSYFSIFKFDLNWNFVKEYELPRKPFGRFIQAIFVIGDIIYINCHSGVADPFRAYNLINDNFVELEMDNNYITQYAEQGAYYDGEYVWWALRMGSFVNKVLKTKPYKEGEYESSL